MEVTSVRSTILTIDIFSENTEDTAERLSCMNEQREKWVDSDVAYCGVKEGHRCIEHVPG